MNNDKKNIVLISPIVGLHDYLYPTPPLSLLTISRKISRKDYNIIIIDQKMSDWKNKLIDALKKKIFLVGITALTGYQLYYGSLIAKYIKRFNRNIKIVWGGVHPSSSPSDTLKEDFVDYVVIGEGEETFPRLVQALARKESLSSVSSIGYKSKKKEVCINKSSALLDVNNLDTVPYDLLDIQRYLEGLGSREFYVEGARGCIYDCSYCYNPIYNRGFWRPLRPDVIIKNIKKLNRGYGLSKFFIIDDSFFLSINRVKVFISLLKKEKLNISWSCEANLCSLGKLNDSLFKELLDSGLDWISIGVESGSKRVRDFYNKPIDIKNLLRFNKEISKFDIKVRYNFMTGSPIEDKKDMLDTVNLIKKLLKDNPKAMIQPIYVTVPFPCTRYLDRCKGYGLKEPKSLEEWSYYDSYEIIKFLPWFSPRNKKIIEFMMYSSYFIDNKVEHHLSDSLKDRIIKVIVKVYRPIARLRFNNFFYFFFFEKYIIKLLNLFHRQLLHHKLGL